MSQKRSERLNRWVFWSTEVGWAVSAVLSAGMIAAHFMIAPISDVRLALFGFLFGFGLQGIFVMRLLRTIRAQAEVHRLHIESLMQVINSDLASEVAKEFHRFTSGEPPEERRLN
jgi:hypothetical protein